MRNFLLLSIAIFLGVIAVSAQTKRALKLVTFTKEQLKDKIMGGWAGQTIAVTFGGPYEFRFNGTFIQDYQPLVWYDGYLKKTMIENPGLYDDLYMDLTFVDYLRNMVLMHRSILSRMPLHMRATCFGTPTRLHVIIY